MSAAAALRGSHWPAVVDCYEVQQTDQARVHAVIFVYLS
jgi:hypothetical protein